MHARIRLLDEFAFFYQALRFFIKRLRVEAKSQLDAANNAKDGR